MKNQKNHDLAMLSSLAQEEDAHAFEACPQCGQFDTLISRGACLYCRCCGFQEECGYEPPESS